MLLYRPWSYRRWILHNGWSRRIAIACTQLALLLICFFVWSSLYSQVHTEDIEQRAESDLTKLVCDTYKV